MLAFPNCKINIGLYITGKRNDGYHNLETLFYPIAVNDILEIIPSEGETTMHLSGKAITGDAEKNLIWKAYELLKSKYPQAIKHLDIYLLKNIPMGAGLGGGSADGAFMLQLLKDYYSLQLTPQQLIDYSLQLGSDCPFFIHNKPVFASGRGEVMQPAALDLSGYSIQLVCPGIHVSTALAFSAITPKPASFNLTDINNLPISEWKGVIKNDFEETVFAAHPTLKKIKETLYADGALYASMTGTGSCVYGIFHKEKKSIHVDEWENFYIL